MTTGKLQITPLGGLGQFGMNMTVFRYNDQMIIVDCGMMFPDEDLLGVDIAIPDLTYIEEHREELAGIVLTHAHEDHVGALPFVLQIANVPIYATQFTLGLVEGKLQEFGLLDKVQTHVINPRHSFKLGQFEIEFIRVSHSLVDCVALAIHTPVGVIIHTGDFKVDLTPVMGEPIDLKRLNEYGDNGVLALLSDSTNVEREGRTGSEKVVIPAFEKIFDDATGRIIVACFSTSIHRLQIIFDLAAEKKRAVALVGRSMIRNVEVAMKHGYLDIEDNQLVSPAKARRMSADEVCLLVTGSQGEPMSALARMSVDTHKDASVIKGDTVVISARQIPGNEKSISRMMNHLFKKDARVIDSGIARIHVSGHGRQEDLKIMHDAVRPKFLIPIHGETRQLYRHAEAARKWGVPRDRIVLAESGDVIELDENSAAVAEKITVGRTLIDDSGSGRIDELVLRDRKHLAYDGIVLPIVAINKTSGELESAPEIVQRGLALNDEGAEFLSKARVLVGQTIANASHQERVDWAVIKEKIRIELKRHIQRETGRRPMIIPVVLEI
ncbi:MAG TPA: ribonuclease J [Blastocatellia bacterium]|nr:ribonuclease J [Blastocatellia bacterium]HMV81775.1 ribonuclease J [Blastocatellia bacterium]HMX24746.1 ribonuclease J [Blastocatellia bacterium]HMY72985.1 ribonuclease J [Blastocatellia bacterium]HMZ16463.1 ribonuclease J [Blastocatellia bacterium]